MHLCLHLRKLELLVPDGRVWPELEEIMDSMEDDVQEKIENERVRFSMMRLGMSPACLM